MAQIAGIDISTWQTDVNYSALAKGKIQGQPIKFVMIRASYGTKEDNMFKTHVDGCLKAGLNVGLYCFSNATTVDGAKQEAEFVISLIKKYGYDGKLTYPIAYDLENESTAKLGSALCTNLCKSFCETIEKYNYKSIIYTNLNWLFWAKNINYEMLKQYPFWIAGYVKESTMSPYKSKASMWQYSVAGDKSFDVAGIGSVDGINGACDCNWSYVDFAAEIKKAGQNKFKTTTSNINFKIGDKVTVNKGAYFVGNIKPYDFVYTTVFDVLDINTANSTVKIGLGKDETGWMYAKDLTKTTAQTTPSISIDSPKFKVGDKVTIKNGALVYFGEYSSSLYLLNMVGSNPYTATYQITSVKSTKRAEDFAKDNNTKTPYANINFHPYTITIDICGNKRGVSVNQNDLTLKK